MFDYLVRIAIVVLVGVILVSAFRTGFALMAVGVGSPEAADILMDYLEVSSIAALSMLVPLIFLFDPLLKRKSPNTTVITAKGETKT